MSTPWTPGPWEVESVDPNEEWGIFEAIPRGEPGEIPGPIGTAFDEADARLIAAAPEMAELLKELLCSECGGEGTVVYPGDLPGRHGWNACGGCDGTGLASHQTNDCYHGRASAALLARIRGEAKVTA